MECENLDRYTIGDAGDPYVTSPWFQAPYVVFPYIPCRVCGAQSAHCFDAYIACGIKPRDQSCRSMWVTLCRLHKNNYDYWWDAMQFSKAVYLLIRRVEREIDKAKKRQETANCKRAGSTTEECGADPHGRQSAQLPG